MKYNHNTPKTNIGMKTVTSLLIAGTSTLFCLISFHGSASFSNAPGEFSLLTAAAVTTVVLKSNNTPPWISLPLPDTHTCTHTCRRGAAPHTSPRICYDLLHLCNCRFGLDALNTAPLAQEDKSHRPEFTKRKQPNPSRPSRSIEAQEEKDAHPDEPAGHLRGARRKMPVCCTSHPLPFSVHATRSLAAHNFFSWASAERGHRLSIRSKPAPVSGDLVPTLQPAADKPSRTYRTCFGLAPSPV